MILTKSLVTTVPKNKIQGREAGFTLVELMVVVAIIAILAAVGLPKMSAFVKTAETSEAVEQSARIVKGIQGYVDSHPDVLPATIYANFQPGVYGNLGNGATTGILTTLIPHVSLPDNATFVYKIAVNFVGTDDATNNLTAGETTVCVKAYKMGAETAYILYSSKGSKFAEWESSVYRAKYIDVNSSVINGGFCDTSGADTTIAALDAFAG
jgi:prepilin-type N-terminal cleavage/methylation domain-containing protein